MATTYNDDDKKTGPRSASIEDEKFSDTASTEFVQGSDGVTVHELETLRHCPDRLPIASWLIVFVEFAERWTYYGTTNIYANYIRGPLPPGSRTGAPLPEFRRTGIPGALGQGVQRAFAIRTFNSFWVYITPFVGAIIADCYLGRYNTIMLFALVCFAGHIILVGASTPAALENTSLSLGLLILAILVMGLGAGAIKANVSPMVAEQYTGKLRKETLPSGEVIIKSPTLTIQSMYMWFYAGINMGSLCAISASFLARDHGYWQAFLVPTVAFLFVPLIMMLGKKHYVIQAPRGSIILEVCRVLVMCTRGHWSLNPVATIRGFRSEGFWDSAKPSSYPAGQIPTKITWDDEFVGEVRRTVKACAVFLFFPFFWLCYSQIDGNLANVAAGMTLNGTPNDLIQNLNPVGIVVMIPIFDFMIYPFLRKRGINFSPIKRIYAGFIVAGFAMVYASVLQAYIFRDSPCHNNEPSACVDGAKQPHPAPYNVWIVAGPYLLVGLAEIFASITAIEYAFTKAPKNMKSTVMAFSQLQHALSSVLNFALVPVNKEPKYVWLFGSFAVTAWVIGTIFFFTFRSLDKEELQLNAIGTGKREGFADERTKEIAAV